MLLDAAQDHITYNNSVSCCGGRETVRRGEGVGCVFILQEISGVWKLLPRNWVKVSLNVFRRFRKTATEEQEMGADRVIYLPLKVNKTQLKHVTVELQKVGKGKDRQV